MRLLLPEAITLLESSLSVSVLPTWAIGTAYTVGTQVTHTLTQQGVALPHRFQALQDHTGQEPVYGGSAYWMWLGATNRWAMFDGLSTYRSTTETGGTPIQVAIEPPRRGDVIVLLGLQDATKVTVRQFENDTTTPELSSQEVDLIAAPPPVGWHTSLFREYYTRPTATIDLPGLHFQPRIEVDIEGAMPSVSQLLHCRSLMSGVAEDGASPGIMSFSPFTTNDFGITRFVPRRNKRELSFSMVIRPEDFDGIFLLLQKYENQLVVVDANNQGGDNNCRTVKTDLDSMRLYGKMTRINPSFMYEKPTIDLRVEEL